MTQGAEAPRVGLQQLLRAMVEKGASDMHITVGVPPLLRIDGEVIPLKLPPLTKEDTKQLAYSIMTEEQKIQFEKDNELDLAFGVKNLSRFRANIFLQRTNVAGAIRTIVRSPRFRVAAPLRAAAGRAQRPANLRRRGQRLSPPRARQGWRFRRGRARFRLRFDIARRSSCVAKEPISPASARTPPGMHRPATRSSSPEHRSRRRT